MSYRISCSAYYSRILVTGNRGSVLNAGGCLLFLSHFLSWERYSEGEGAIRFLSYAFRFVTYTLSHYSVICRLCICWAPKRYIEQNDSGDSEAGKSVISRHNPVTIQLISLGWSWTNPLWSDLFARNIYGLDVTSHNWQVKIRELTPWQGSDVVCRSSQLIGQFRSLTRVCM
jgi:hypothetical protein